MDMMDKKLQMDKLIAEGASKLIVALDQEVSGPAVGFPPRSLGHPRTWGVHVWKVLRVLGRVSRAVPVDLRRPCTKSAGFIRVPAGGSQRFGGVTRHPHCICTEFGRFWVYFLRLVSLFLTSSFLSLLRGR